MVQSWRFYDRIDICEYHYDDTGGGGRGRGNILAEWHSEEKQLLLYLPGCRAVESIYTRPFFMLCILAAGLCIFRELSCFLVLTPDPEEHVVPRERREHRKGEKTHHLLFGMQPVTLTLTVYVTLPVTLNFCGFLCHKHLTRKVV